MKKTIKCNIHSSCLTSFKGDVFLPPNDKFTIIVDYPFLTENAAYRFKCKTGKRGMDVFAIFRKIGRIYKHVFKHADKYGPFFHDYIFLESVTVNYDEKIITLGVGS